MTRLNRPGPSPCLRSSWMSWRSALLLFANEPSPLATGRYFHSRQGVRGVGVRHCRLVEGGFASRDLQKTAAALSEPPLSFQTSRSRVYIPLEHFLAAVSQCMPAFSHAACVLGVPANAGALNATIRLRARTETNAFIRISSDAVTSLLRCSYIAIKSVQNVTTLLVLCYAVSRPE